MSIHERVPQSYRFPIEHRENEPHSNIAILFPGQSIQKVGMGKDIANDPAAAEVFERASCVMQRKFNKDILSLMFEGPHEELNKTENTQPAVGIVSIGSHNVNRRRRVDGYATLPRYVTGHSMGMITAVILSGAMELEDGIELLGWRGKITQEECKDMPETRMKTTLNAQEEQVDAVLDQHPSLDLCLINSDSRFVIGGPIDDLERAAEELKKQKVRVVDVNTDRAMHGRYVRPAKEKFVQVVYNARMKNPIVPIIGSKDGRPLRTVEEIREELLYEFDNTFDLRYIMRFFNQTGIHVVSEVNHDGTFAKILAGALGGVAVAAAAGIGIYEWRRHQTAA